MDSQRKSGSAARFEREFSQSMRAVQESLGEVSKPRKVERDIAVRTGIPSLDSALGGGLPSGLVEIFGGMSVGKTAMSAAIIKQAQRDRMEVAYAPTESQEGAYLERCGVKLGSLVVIRGRSPEALEECFVDWFQSGRRRLLVLDSINAARPYDQGQFDWNAWAYHFLLKMKDTIPVRSAMVTTGQARFKRNPDGKFEGREESASRRVTDLFDVRLELVRSEVGEDEYTMLVNILANILRQPGLYLDLRVQKGYGIDVEHDMVKAALALGIIERFGSSYHVDGVYVARGIEGMKKRLGGDARMKKLILDAVLAKWS